MIRPYKECYQWMYDALMIRKEYDVRKGRRKKATGSPTLMKNALMKAAGRRSL